MTPTCTNCGSTLVDVYCARCSEKQPHRRDLTLSHFAHDVVHEMVHLDSKLFRTLKALVVQPGFLTAEAFAGRKTRYITPLRLFLTLFALHVLAYTIYKPLSIYSVGGASKMSGSPGIERLLEKVAKKRGMTKEVIAEQVDAKWQKNISLLQLVNVLGIALVLKLIYWRRYFAEHLTFAAHYLSFTYLFALAIWPVYWVVGLGHGIVNRSLMAVTIIASMIYAFFALRRFYNGRAVFLRTLLFYAGAYVVSVILLGGALFAAVFQVLKA